MKRDPVLLSVEQRRRAVDTITWSLLRRKIQILIAAVDRVHLHLLTRFPDHNPRQGASTFVARNIPFDVCDACGEQFFSSEAMDAIRGQGPATNTQRRKSSNGRNALDGEITARPR